MYLYTLHTWPDAQIHSHALYSCKLEQQQWPHPAAFAGCSGLAPLGREYVTCMCVHYGQSLSPASGPKYPVSAGAGTWTCELPKPLFWSSFQSRLPDTQTWAQMHTAGLLAAGLPCAICSVAGSWSSFSTQVSQSTPGPSSPFNSCLGLCWSLWYPPPLVNGDRLWDDPNSLCHGILVMDDPSVPKVKTAFVGLGQSSCLPGGYWGSLSCHSAIRLTGCCRWEDSSDGMGEMGQEKIWSSLQIDDPLCSFGCKWSSFLSQQSNTR